VQLHATVDWSGRPVGYENFDWATILPRVPNDDSAEGKRLKPQTYLTARTSRFGLRTRTPTRLGDVKLTLEADFNGPNDFQSETYTNSTVFRLRQAHATLGGLLVGQTWSTFFDGNASPETVDFNGPGTQALVRNPQIRYTFGFAQGFSLALAAENTRGPQFGVDPRFQTIPDLHANLSYAPTWGSVSVRTVVQTFNRARLTTDPDGNDVYADQAAETKVGFAFAASGSLKLGKDTLLAQFVGGPGIGRYVLNTNNLGNSGPGVTVDADGDIELWSVYGGHVGYTHAWSDVLRSTLVAAYTWVDDPEIGGASATNAVQRDFIQAFANVYYSPIKTMNVGLEYEFGRWRSFTNGTPEQRGTQNRVSAAFNYSFW
jgi:hypothetical protein